MNLQALTKRCFASVLSFLAFALPSYAGLYDATFKVMGDQLVIETRIYIYGEAASTEAAEAIRDGINRYWARSESGAPWTYVDPATSRKYSVSFKVSVELYDGKPYQMPSVIPEAWNPFNRNNYIEVISDQNARSSVRGGDEGVWVFPPMGDHTYAHEFGHLLGFDDRYPDPCPNPNDWCADEGWDTNIMSSTPDSKVEQRNIDSIASYLLDRAKDWHMNHGELDNTRMLD